MDRSEWILLKKRIRRAVNAVGRSRGVIYSDELILKLFFWAVAHDRPLCWACNRMSFGGGFRPRRLPSRSQFCKRIKSRRFQAFLRWIHDDQTNHSQLSVFNYLDGKPLAVNKYSRDPEATIGFGAGQFQRGYKLHVLTTDDRKIASWSLQSLHKHEKNVARCIVEHLPSIRLNAIFMADGNYDSADFHKQIHRRGGFLWTKPRGIAEHPVTLRQMGASRRMLLHYWRTNPDWCAAFQHRRIHVEGTLSNLTCYGGGLGPLPAFVRRKERVTRWVGAKIILYHERLQARKSVAKDN